MARPENRLSIGTASNLLSIIRPGYILRVVKPIMGGYSNHTHLVEIIGPDGNEERIVIRRYSSGNRERGQKAVREFKVLEILRKYGIPAPEPIYLDESGAILGIPGIVTSYIEGESELTPANPEERASAIAAILAKLHSISYSVAEADFLLDANSEATWFLRDNKADETMKSHPLGFELLEASRKLQEGFTQSNLALVHTDIWPGNIIWQENKLSGIVDWDDAGYGDPALDIGYCRMELSIAGYLTAADVLLREYEKVSGSSVANLRFWELAAAAKPILKPEIWDVVNEPRRGRFAKFVEVLLDRNA